MATITNTKIEQKVINRDGKPHHTETVQTVNTKTVPDKPNEPAVVRTTSTGNTVAL